MTALIVNADDFGRTRVANRAIVEAFSAGLVTSASLMATAPAFEEAVELARVGKLTLGVHLVLTEGVPLTQEIRVCARFCNPDGSFAVQARKRLARLTHDEGNAVSGELGAQIERVRAAGIEPAHLDSHHHVHNDWAVGRIVIDLAHRFEVPRVRIARNCGPGISAVHQVYKRLYNERLRRANLAGTRWFGNADDYRSLSAKLGAPPQSFELMTHPLLDDSGGLVDLEFPDQPLAATLA